MCKLPAPSQGHAGDLSINPPKSEGKGCRFMARKSSNAYIRLLIFLIVFSAALGGVLPAPAFASDPVLPPELSTVDATSIKPSRTTPRTGDSEPVVESEPVDTGRIFDMVGASWEIPSNSRSGQGLDGLEGSEPLFEVRGAVEPGKWGPWISSDEADGPDPSTGEGVGNKVTIGPIYLGPSRYVQIRWRGPHGIQSPPEVTTIDIQGRRAPLLAKAAAYFRAIFRSRPLLAKASSPQPSIVSRAGWGADESLRRGEPSYGAVKLAIVHHTVSTNVYGPGDSAAIVRGIYAYHVLTNGWNDIGYNFLIDRYGQIFEGRYGGIDQPVIGAHSWGSNSQSTGIAIIGDFSSASIPGPAFASLVALVDWKLDVHSVDPTARVDIVRTDGVPLNLRAVSGHRDAFPTSCPGNGVYGTLDSAAQQARDSGGQKVFGARWIPEQPRWLGNGFESVRFSAYLKYDAAWKVTIVDSRGASLLTRTGSGASIDVFWDARFPDKRSVLPGTYYAVVEVQGSMTKRIPLQLTAGPTFEQWFLTYNPNAVPTEVTLTLSGNEGVLGVKNFVVQPKARHTFFVNDYVVGKEVSARVDSLVPVVVERAMYFDYQRSFDGGDAAFGVPQPDTQWYFAEGYTGGSFAEYLTLYNPQDSDATTRVEFLFNPTGSQNLDVVVPSKSRKTIFVNSVVGSGKEVAIQISSNIPIVAERPQYYDYLGYKGGDVVVGARSPLREWTFSEGYTGRGFHTYLTLANPGSIDAVVTVELLGNQGLLKRLEGVLVKAKGRTTIFVNYYVGPGKDVSAKVSSTQPIVAERPMYFGYGEVDGGHVALGAVSAKTKYFFAEGYTAPGFDEYLSLLNPNASPISVQGTYSFPSGAPIVKSYSVGPNSRLTIAVHDEVRRAGEVSVALESSSPFFAERPMYFHYRGAWKGGSIVQGGAEPASQWYFAEGYTG